MGKIIFRTILLLVLAACKTTIPSAESQAAMQIPDSKTQVSILTPTNVFSIEAGVFPVIDPFTYSGDIVMAGSSTIFPISERMAERFNEEGFRGNITIDSIGSGAGFERFCVSGEIDIANASRPIKEGEIESCRSIQRDPIAFRIGTDSLVVVVRKDNPFLSDITLDELAELFSTSVNWSDINPDWPDEPVQRFSPGTDSGTYDFFVGKVLAGNEASLLNASALQLSEDDNVLVQGISGSPYAVGYFGFAYYLENQDLLKAVSVNGIVPSAETVESNKYPLARPLFLYSDATIMKQKPQVAAFINFYLTYINEEILDIGYFPASLEMLSLDRETWLNAIK